MYPVKPHRKDRQSPSVTKLPSTNQISKSLTVLSCEEIKSAVVIFTATRLAASQDVDWFTKAQKKFSSRWLHVPTFLTGTTE